MLKNYIKTLSSVVSSVDEEILKKSIKTIDNAIKKKRQILICGNGGSASLSDHALCDWTKRLYPKKKCKILDLTSNKSLISAISNDINFDQIFSYQINVYSGYGDICIFISSSGNSKNILEGIKAAKKKKIESDCNIRL